MNPEEISVAHCVKLLKEADGGKKAPYVDGVCILDYLKEHCSRTGLTSEQIVELAQLVASRKYSDAVGTSVIKCLIPNNHVPAIIFIKTVSWLCAELLSSTLQVAFLKWLILIYEWIDDKDTVHSVYGMLFLFLDNEKLSPYIAHLLYLMTRKEDVVLFRFKRLLDLIYSAGPLTHYIGLMSAYKMHSPHLVTFSIPRKIKVFFKRVDATWLDLAWDIQRKSRGNPTQDRVLLSTATSPTTVMPPAKRRRKDMLVKPFFSNLEYDSATKTIDRVSSFDDFLDHIDEIQFPIEMSTVLRSRYLQHLFVLRNDEEAVLRFDFWLKNTFQRELIESPSGETRDRVSDFLTSLLAFLSITKEPPACLEECLSRYLLTWNGADYSLDILLLVAHLKVVPFQRLNNYILESLRKLFFSSPIYFKCQVICCFCKMLSNMVCLANNSLNEEVEDITENEAGVSKETNINELHLTIKKFINFVDNLCSVALQMESDHVLLQHWVLCFFEQVSVVCQQYGLKIVQIPSPSIVYRMLFSVDAMVLSRLCKLIVNYKNEFEYLKKDGNNSKFADFPDGLDSISQFNRYILDISDTLWRNRAFVDRTYSLCYNIPRSVTDSLGVPRINEKFSIQNHPALVYLRKKYLEAKIKDGYKEYLQQNRLHGIILFIDSFIKTEKQFEHRNQGSRKN